MVLAIVGHEPAVGREQAVELGHDGRCPRRERHVTSTLLNAPSSSERGGQFALVHPKDAEATVVRQRLAGPRLEDESGDSAMPTIFKR